MDTKSSCSNDHDEPKDLRHHEVGPILKNVLSRGKLQVTQFLLAPHLTHLKAMD